MLISDKIIVIDIEATCWEDQKTPIGQEVDIIEIGICNLIIETGEITDRQSYFVKPERSEISTYCHNLTGISLDFINENGINFLDVCDKIVQEYEPFGRVWSSYGEFDRQQLLKQCEAFQVKLPFGLTHLNIKSLFALKKKLKHAKGLTKALKILNEPLEGNHHSGMDDAYNAAKILRWILNN